MNSDQSVSKVQDENTGTRVAIVTGGTRGMGLAISESLARAGLHVLAVYRSNHEEAQKAAARMREQGLELTVKCADIGIQQESLAVAALAGKQWGRIDILVNNAGIFDFCFLEDMSEAFFDHVYQTNLKSMIFMMQAVIPWMKKNPGGRIVNATSISGTLADVGLVAYACSKAGVNLLTKVSAGELAPYGITVNAYAPGIIHTDMTDAMIRERGELQLRQIPAGSFGKSEDVAHLVSFLCSEEAAYITGEIIGVDGGMMKVQNPYRAYAYVKEKGTAQP
jgi:3-oxoacyl-[acyl-carrier protein] reductase